MKACALCHYSTPWLGTLVCAHVHATYKAELPLAGGGVPVMQQHSCTHQRERGACGPSGNDFRRDER
jgi:hypothetical protein